jgi:hypothetical protein
VALAIEELDPKRHDLSGFDCGVEPLNGYLRSLAARHTLDVGAVLVEAKDSAAEVFYRKYDFRLCNTQTRQLYLPLGRD